MMRVNENNIYIYIYNDDYCFDELSNKNTRTPFVLLTMH